MNNKRLAMANILFDRGLKTIGAFFLLLIFSAPSFAQDIPARPNPPTLVNDLAHMLNPDELAQLEGKLERYNDSTSTQIVVITVNDLGGNEIAQYAFAIGDKWGVGRKHKDNGVVILISKGDRKAFIATGKGMEGAVPDAYCRRIVDNIIVPNFKQEQYYQGLDDATTAIIKLAAGEFVNDVNKDKKQGFPAGLIVLIVIVIIIIISRIGRGSGGSGAVGSGGWLAGPILWGGGGGGGGFSGGGGGGFGGFGGGSFGGGGAGGSW